MIHPTQTQTTHIGQRIRNVRKAQNMNQYEFAAELGIKQPSLSQIEQGVIRPSLKVIQMVAKTYQVSYAWLLDGVGEMESRMPLRDDIPQDDPAYALSAVEVVHQANQPEYMAATDKAAFTQRLPVMYLPRMASGRMRIFELGDETMEPNLHRGDLLLCTEVESVSQILPGMIYVFVGQREIHYRKVANNLYWQKELILYPTGSESGLQKFRLDRNPVTEIWQTFARFTLHFDSSTFEQQQQLQASSSKQQGNPEQLDAPERRDAPTARAVERLWRQRPMTSASL